MFSIKKEEGTSRIKRRKDKKIQKEAEVGPKTSVQVIKGVFSGEMLSELLKTEFANNPLLKEIAVIDPDKVSDELLFMISTLGFDLKIDSSLKSIYILYFNIKDEEVYLTKADCFVVDEIEEKIVSDLSEKGIVRFVK